jgi:hypothetical protein
MPALGRLIQWAQGKKTYLSAIALAVIGILWSDGYISDDTAKLLAMLFNAASVASLRDALGKRERATDAN